MKKIRKTAFRMIRTRIEDEYKKNMEKKTEEKNEQKMSRQNRQHRQIKTIKKLKCQQEAEVNRRIM